MSNPLLRAFCSNCLKNGMECECKTFYPNVIVELGTPIDREFVERYLTERRLGYKLLSISECQDLINYFQTEYISHEFHPNVHGIIKNIEAFIRDLKVNENPTKNQGTQN